MSASRFLAAFLVMLLLTSISSAPTPRIFGTLVSGETTGLEMPRNLIAGIGANTGAMQLVVNVHTDSHGNIEGIMSRFNIGALRGDNSSVAWHLTSVHVEHIGIFSRSPRDMEGLSWRPIKGEFLRSASGEAFIATASGIATWLYVALLHMPLVIRRCLPLPYIDKVTI